MELINWIDFSNVNCENIRHEISNNENTLHLYAARVKKLNDIRYFIVYENNIVHMGGFHNDMLNYFFGMKILLEHIHKKGGNPIMNNEKLWVIIQHDFVNGGYLQHAVDGLLFKTPELAEEYRKIKPDYDSTGVEELIVYSTEKERGMFND